MGFSSTFLWSLRLSSIFLAVRVESSHASKQQNKLFHAFDLLFRAKVVELRTWSIFLFFMWVESSSTLWCNMLAILSFSECLGLGAFILKWHVCSSSRLGNGKSAKNTMLLTRNPYRLWSFQLGPQNMSKIRSSSENIVFYVTKLNHTVLHHFPGARMLIWPFSCSLTVIYTKV